MHHNSIIRTERTYLCTADTLKFEHIRKLDSDPEIMRYINNGKPRSIQESRDWITKRLSEYDKYGFGLMPVYLKESDEFIGWGGLKHLEETSKIELGYRLDKAYWSQGYATEIAKAIIEYAKKELGINEIVAVTDVKNEGSKKVLLKAGFAYVSQAFYYQTTVDYFELKL